MKRMKLRNKKTGEIVDFGYLQSDYVAPLVLTTYENDEPKMYKYDSLAELNSEWEDYEKPKEFWFIDEEGIIRSTNEENWPEESVVAAKSIGDYFETKEEAEKAVEKLKAWKRLKDKGFRFKCWYGGSKNIDWEITSLENETYIPRQICDDLDLLFGGGE